MLSPTVVAAITDLELAARLVVEGLRAGGHRSPFLGYTTEFRQHRPYRAGDDLKHLDWKLYARSDRLYTRQFRETTNLPLMVVLDASASMGFPAEPPSKLRYGQIIAAALSYLASEQGHAVGLMAMQGERLAHVPARGGRPHLRSLLARIGGLSPAGRWDPARVIARAAHLLRRRGIIIVISDFYDDEDATQRAIGHVARYGHDVAMLHVLSPGELTLPYDGQVELEDAESSERRLVDGAAASAGYAAAVREFMDRCRSRALRDGVEYALLSTDTPPEAALRRYLIARSRGHERVHAPYAVGR